MPQGCGGCGSRRIMWIRTTASCQMPWNNNQLYFGTNISDCRSWIWAILYPIPLPSNPPVQFEWHRAQTKTPFLSCNPTTQHPLTSPTPPLPLPPNKIMFSLSQGSPEWTVFHRSTWCHTWELDTVGGVGGVLTGDVCFGVLFSTGFFLVLLLFFWDFVSVAVEGVTGNFTGLEDWFEDLTTMQKSVKKYKSYL